MFRRPITVTFVAICLILFGIYSLGTMLYVLAHGSLFLNPAALFFPFGIGLLKGSQVSLVWAKFLCFIIAAWIIIGAILLQFTQKTVIAPLAYNDETTSVWIEAAFTFTLAYAFFRILSSAKCKKWFQQQTELKLCKNINSQWRKTDLYQTFRDETKIDTQGDEEWLEFQKWIKPQLPEVLPDA